MIGAAIGTAIGSADSLGHEISEPTRSVDLAVSTIVIPQAPNAHGILVKANSAVWQEIVCRLQLNWNAAFDIPPHKWEEIIAGAFDKAGYDEVVLTPRSGDYGRDVVAFKHGIGCIKVIGSVKAYRKGNLVPYDAVRALLGVLNGELDASKGIITTTSDFPPRIKEDPYIAPFLPTRLQLINGQDLQSWLARLNLST